MISLRIALFLAGVCLIVACPCAWAHTDVTPEQAHDLIDSVDGLIVVDVREPSEYCDARGHIPGAQNYPLNSGVLQARFEELPMDSPILVVCRSGGRSNQAANFLDSQGFSTIYDMTGGMNAWQWETAPCKYAGGSGTDDDPYQIATAADLIALGGTPDDYDKHFILTADIDLDPNLPGRKVFDGAVIAPDTSVEDDGFQGEPFAGVFDGNDHTISRLEITGESHLGLFGWLSGDVTGLGVVDVNILGSDCIGGLAGYNDEGDVDACHSTGAVAGTWVVGGLVGVNSGSIENSCSSADITAVKGVGGLVGRNRSLVANCYSTAAICGSVYVGGLVGDNDPNAMVTHSYSASVIDNNSDPANQTEPEGIGGLTGRNMGDVIDCFWDVEISDFSLDGDGLDLTTAQMQTADTFLNAGWDFVCEAVNGTEDIWSISEPNYPRLAWELQEVPACPAAVVELYERNFDATIAQGVVLVDFYATWCSHCRTQAPILDDVAEQVRGKAQVAKLDIDQARSVAQSYGVTAIPTLIVFREGEIFERFLGVTQAPILIAAIQSAIDYQPPAHR